VKAIVSCTLFAAMVAGFVAVAPHDASAQTVGSQSTPGAVYGKILSGMESEIVGAAEAMPADKYDFAPSGSGNFQGVRTFGQQVKHLAQANYHYFSMLGAKPTVDVKGIDKLTSKDQIVQALKDSYAFGAQALNTITAQNAFVVMDARGTTRAGIATSVLAHANDHYGQMVEYLRMNNIIPPASRK
jgi:uncharacterized damage-inducible protein DinB